MTDIQDHPDFEEQDIEALGARQVHDIPNGDEAKPVISKITFLPELILYDWIKTCWYGVAVQTGIDGINWTYQQPDMRSPWDDTVKNKQAGLPEYRYTRFRYLDKEGKEIGHWTDPIKVLAEIY